MPEGREPLHALISAASQHGIPSARTRSAERFGPVPRLWLTLVFLPFRLLRGLIRRRPMVAASP